MTRTLTALLLTSAIIPAAAFADPLTDASIVDADKKARGSFSVHTDHLFDLMTKPTHLKGFSVYAPSITTSRAMNKDLGDTKYTDFGLGYDLDIGSVTGFMSYGNPDPTSNGIEFTDDVFAVGLAFSDQQRFGPSFSAGLGYTKGDVEITRDDANGAEPGAGTTNLTAFAGTAEIAYGFEAARHASLQPFFRLESALLARDGYTENAGATDLVAYDDSYSFDTRIVLGTRAELPVLQGSSLTVDAGMTKEVLRKADDISGSYAGADYSMDQSEADSDLQLHAKFGLVHKFRFGGELNGSLGFQQSPFSDEITTKVGAGYAHRF